jgi:hypothetical protein
MGTVLARTESSRRRPAVKRRFGALATGFACLLLGGAVATAATGVLDPALDSFFGGGGPPGQTLPASELPYWLKPAPGFNAPDEVAVVAGDGSEHLYAYRQSDQICFDYGHHVGECRSPEEWRLDLENEPWIIRGPVGRSAWYGLVGVDTVSVRIKYRDEEAEVPVHEGGFVVVPDPARDPQALIALDASGTQVAEQPLGD